MLTDFSSLANDSLLERHFLNLVVIIIATVTLRFISAHFLGIMNIDKDEDLGEQHYFFQSSIKMRGNIVVEKTI